MMCTPPSCTVFPYTTLFRSPGTGPGGRCALAAVLQQARGGGAGAAAVVGPLGAARQCRGRAGGGHHRPAPEPRVQPEDRKSTRLNSSHVASSYAVFCLKEKK